VAEAEPTKEPALPNPKDDEARERAWENENRAGFRELRPGLWEIKLAHDTPDFGSCTQVMRQLGGEEGEDACRQGQDFLASHGAPIAKDGTVATQLCITGKVDPLRLLQELYSVSSIDDCRFTVLSRVDNKIKFSQNCPSVTGKQSFVHGATIHSDTDVSFTLLKQAVKENEGVYMTGAPKSARWLASACDEPETKCNGIESCVLAATMNMRNECMKLVPKEHQGSCANLGTGVSRNAAESACKKPQDEDCVKGLTFAGMSQMEAQGMCSARKNKKAEAACYK
jgi:hypothetical protein